MGSNRLHQGAHPHQAIGHTTLKEVARYTRAANQERLAADAVDMLTEQKAAKNSQTFIDGLGNRKNS
jgi:hypothetical protein